MSEARKIELKGRSIPRDKTGDPTFLQLGEFLKPEERNPKGDLAPQTVLDVFTPEEVTIIVNRYIKFQEASALTHKKLAERNRARMKPINDKIREMYGKSPSKATNEEIAAAIEMLVKEKGDSA